MTEITLLPLSPDERLPQTAREAPVSAMVEIKNDAFFDFIRPYDPNNEYHFVGEVDYHLLKDEKPHEGLPSHREALSAVFDRLAEDSMEELKGIRERCGGDTAELLSPLAFEIGRAQASPLDPNDFFYCPNIVKTDHCGKVTYDAAWSPGDEKLGTAVPYWYALLEPVHGRRNKPEDFRKVNEVLFPNGTDALEVCEWTTDWSDFFDAGHEWYGACCWSVYDRSMDRYAVMLVSATD